MFKSVECILFCKDIYYILFCVAIVAVLVRFAAYFAHKAQFICLPLRVQKSYKTLLNYVLNVKTVC